MTRTRSELIRSLGDDLTPVPRPGRIAPLVAVWLVLSWLYTLIVVSLTGDWRPGALGDLAASPQFAFENLLGLVAGGALIVAALALGIPAPSSALRRIWPALALSAAWALVYVLGFWHPGLDPSMLGKREWCFVETLIYSVPPIALGLALMRRLAPLNPRLAGALLGLAAGALPALAMQFACMYEPMHTLTHHLAPALLSAALAAGIAPWALRSRIPAV